MKSTLLYYYCCLLSIVVATSSSSTPAATGGRYLFYMPFATRSMTIMVMPLVEELAARGHLVVVVVPEFGLSSRHEKVSFVTFEDPFSGGIC